MFQLHFHQEMNTRHTVSLIGESLNKHCCLIERQREEADSQVVTVATQDADGKTTEGCQDFMNGWWFAELVNY